MSLFPEKACHIIQGGDNFYLYFIFIHFPTIYKKAQ